MFTSEFTISFSPETFGLKQLQLDSEKLSKVFTETEINLINDLSFFEETVIVPTIENKEMSLDSFAIGMYDFIRGCIKLIDMEETEFNDVLRQYPHLISKEHLTERMKLGKQILYKYHPETENKLF